MSHNPNNFGGNRRPELVRENVAIVIEEAPKKGFLAKLNNKRTWIIVGAAAATLTIGTLVYKKFFAKKDEECSQENEDQSAE